ncbi:MAG: triose-phosphate isomerase [Candidatus Saccharibacteria bacterium]
MTRRPLIAGNWKMFKTTKDAADYISVFTSAELDAEPEVAILAPFTCLGVFANLDSQRIVYGAQNIFWEKEGAFTGEISPLMLNDLGCTYVLIGHSERRQIMQETDEMINLKVKTAVIYKLKPMLCVGETLDERQQGQAEAVVGRQIELDLDGVDFNEDLVIAYEPVWAIGTGVNATAKDAQDMSDFIRRKLSEKYGAEPAAKIRILYGGSVKPENIAEFMQQKDVDGALVGGASLDPKSFASIVNYSRQ